MIEDEVISIKLAIKLKELGLRVPSLYSWIHRRCGVKWYVAATASFNLEYHPERLNAYSAQEIMHLLPATVDIKQNEPFNYFRFNMHIAHITKTQQNSVILIRNYSINYHCDTFEIGDNCHFPRQLFDHNIFDANIANACAKTLIWLIENGHVKVDNNSDKVDKV